MIQADVKISSFIEYAEETNEYFIYTTVMDGMHSTILEFADITDYVDELLYVNEVSELYTDEEDLLISLERGYFNRFMGRQEIDAQLDLLLNLRMKMRHKSGTCYDDCILCNPDLGDDPFPSFTWDLRTKDFSGEESN